MPSIKTRNGKPWANIKAVSGVEAGAASTLKTNLISYWKLDETGTPSTFADVHGGKNLTISGSPTYLDSGKIGHAWGDFYAQTAYASRASEASFNPGSSPFFMTAWVDAVSLDMAAYPGLLSKSGSAGNIGWGLQFHDGSNKLYLAASANGSTETFKEVGSALTTFSWFFFAGGWDGTNLVVSINGEDFLTQSFAGPVYDSTAPLELGARAGGGALFRGYLDEVAFWKGRCLSQSEVADIYNAGSGLAYSSWT
jgi:hypothetical protein